MAFASYMNIFIISRSNAYLNCNSYVIGRVKKHRVGFQLLMSC